MTQKRSIHFRFSTRRLFLLTALISIGVALTVLINNRLARQRLLDLPGEIALIRVEYPLGRPPYTIGPVESRRLGMWIANSKPERTSRGLTPAFQIELCFDDGSSCYIEFSTIAGSNSPEQIYFEWENKLRVGNHASIRSIVEHTAELPFPNDRHKNFYSDQNHDGVIDTMHQMDWTNSHAIVWEDTDGNGIFDIEYFTNHGEVFGPKSTIEVPVPTDAKEEW